MKRQVIAITVMLISIIGILTLQQELGKYQGKILLATPEYSQSLVGDEINTNADNKSSEVSKVVEQLERINTHHKGLVLNQVLWHEKVVNTEGEAVVVTFTDEGKMASDHLKKIKGRYFVKSDIKSNKPYVVINKTLAIKAFSSLECIGETMMIEDEPYTVIGIVDQSSFIARAVHNRAQAYLPITKEQAQYILIECVPQNTMWLNRLIKEEIQGVTIQNLELDTYRSINKIRASILVVLLGMGFKVLVATKKRIKVLQNRFQIALEKDYFWKALKEQVSSWIIPLIGGIGLIIIGFMLFSIKFKVNPEHIPSSLAYYSVVKETIVKLVNDQSERQFFATSYRQTIDLIDNVLNICLILFWASVVYIQLPINKENN